MITTRIGSVSSFLLLLLLSPSFRAITHPFSLSLSLSLISSLFLFFSSSLDHSLYSPASCNLHSITCFLAVLVSEGEFPMIIISFLVFLVNKGDIPIIRMIVGSDVPHSRFFP